MATDSLNWAEPEYLVFLALVPLAWLLLFTGDSLVRRRLQALLGQASQSLLRGIGRQRPLSYVLWTLILAAIAIALARPRWGYEWREVNRQGVDIMVVLDVSRSMDAQDIRPSRLARAKREVIDLIRMLEGDRVGLVVFAGVAFVQCPLTIDYKAVQLFLDHIDTEMIPVPGTAIGDALSLAQKSLNESETDKSAGKAIILITDGEDHGGKTTDLARQLAQDDIRIFTIGMGTGDGAPIPAGNGGFLKDESGAVVISRLRESSLREISAEANGVYVASDTSDFDLDRIYRQSIQAEMSEGEIYSRRERLWYERFYWFSGLAFLALSIECLRRRRT